MEMVQRGLTGPQWRRHELFFTDRVLAVVVVLAVKEEQTNIGIAKIDALIAAQQIGAALRRVTILRLIIRIVFPTTRSFLLDMWNLTILVGSLHHSKTPAVLVNVFRNGQPHRHALVCR